MDPDNEKAVAPTDNDDRFSRSSQLSDRGQGDADHTHLHRGLKARQITMIAIGGAIGTGLIIGTGAALTKAGPGAILISYTFVGFLVWVVMCAIGEMAAWLPLEGGFTAFADRYCDDALGFALGYVSIARPGGRWTVSSGFGRDTLQRNTLGRHFLSLYSPLFCSLSEPHPSANA